MEPVNDTIPVEPDPLWVAVRTEVEEQIERSDLEDWIAPLTLLELQDKTACIGAPNVFCA